VSGAGVQTRRNITNAVILTGDFHSSMAFEMSAAPLDKNACDPATGKGSQAVEQVTPGISSSNYNEYPGHATVLTIGKLYRLPEHNPHLKFTHLSDHGYILLTLTPRAAQADFRYVDRLDAL
jgi:alkaline phosphatase D